MSKDSIMRNLSLLNTLWDGGELPIGRKSSESFTVRGTRLTISLQVQEAVLRNFIEKSGDLARGSGFPARFLLAWPESTQRTRRFGKAPEHWPHLAAFNRRIAEMVHRSPTVSALWAGSVPNRSFLHRSSSLCEPRRTSCSTPSSGLR
ncbi:MAG: DUF3987 domain-containing protein [Candidatus Thiosymbion ectosymbiont of Robbea hypermnestra]|nr:DUF3987 domain-containing protein [Candidatus Thiosymbion ectosymbiont of Robbea hypermnestra]